MTLGQDETKRISLWSGPRNVSTALMYSFSQRPDTRVIDEPLYAHYLTHSSAREYHPGSEEIIASMDADVARVVEDVIFGHYSEPVVFFKNMAHHLVEMDWEFMIKLENVLLIRDPSEVLLSYSNQVNKPILRDTGYDKQCQLLDFLEARRGLPPILDSKELLRNSEGVLERLCERLDIAYYPQMLHWEPGPRKEDGIWAKHWYENVHRSSGFQPYRPKKEKVPARLQELLEECRPYYEKLRSHAIEA